MKKIITILVLIATLLSCKNKTEKQENVTIQNTYSLKTSTLVSYHNDTKQQNTDKKTERKVNQNIAENFLKNLMKGNKLDLFFNDTWTFVYHEDNRCDGSTDGKKNNLSPQVIDEIIKLKVKNDGDGWACDKKEKTEFNLIFELKKQVKNWDRFEIPNYENQGKDGIIYITGGGESDYLILHYNTSNLIVKMEYRSEDPG